MLFVYFKYGVMIPKAQNSLENQKMERMLGLTFKNGKADIEILVCKWEFEGGKFSYGCKLLYENGSVGEGINQNLEELAHWVASILEKKVQEYDSIEWFVVHFPVNHIVSANIHGQLNLLTSLSVDEQRKFFGYFAAEFRRLGLDNYYSKRREAQYAAANR